MKLRSDSLTIVLLGLVVFAPFIAAAPTDRPPAEGLVLWLDASDPATLKVDDKGQITSWRSKVGELAAVSQGDGATPPALIEHALHGKPAVRFAGDRNSLATDRPIRSTRGPATVFVVFQRSAEQASQQKWQRLLSSRFEPKSRDTESPNFHLLSDDDGQPAITEPTIAHREFADVKIGQLFIGSAPNGWNGLHGDIAEALVYDRVFLSEGEQRLVLDYLHEKWNAKINETGWTRVGELGQAPKHDHADLPMSDQANAGHWTLDNEFTDEFNADKLDMKRWHLDPTSPGDWNGREPALFMPSNVEQKEGLLNLTFRKGDVPEMKWHPGYAGYTSALIRTNARSGYGYYEIRARAMPSAASSSFWLTDTGIPNQGTEIDVFEIGAKGKGFEHKYNMNAHVWRTPEENRHWSVGGVWNSPWNFFDDFHVYGFEWNKEELSWYVDGVIVRRAKNTNWFWPMHILFDTEAMFTWFGKVDDADLPSTYSIDYLRVWRR